MEAISKQIGENTNQITFKSTEVASYLQQLKLEVDAEEKNFLRSRIAQLTEEIIEMRKEIIEMRKKENLLLQQQIDIRSSNPGVPDAKEPPHDTISHGTVFAFFRC